MKGSFLISVIYAIIIFIILTSYEKRVDELVCENLSLKFELGKLTELTGE